MINYDESTTDQRDYLKSVNGKNVADTVNSLIDEII